MANKEYIEREKAINAVFDAFADGRSAYIALESIPAADVRPVVKAFWIDIWSESDPNTSPSAKCSNCYMTSERPVGFFCKWCGADMREES